MEVEVVEVVLDALFGRGDGHVVAIHAFEVGVVVLYALNGVPLKFKRAVDIGYRFGQNLAVAVGVACGEVALVVVIACQHFADEVLQTVNGEQFAHQSRHPARRAVAVTEGVAVDEVEAPFLEVVPHALPPARESCSSIAVHPDKTVKCKI